MYKHIHAKKNYGFTPNLYFNPAFTKFNFTEFLHTCIKPYAAHQEERTSKPGMITIVSIELEKRCISGRIGKQKLYFPSVASYLMQILITIHSCVHFWAKSLALQSKGSNLVEICTVESELKNECLNFPNDNQRPGWSTSSQTLNN